MNYSVNSEVKDSKEQSLIISKIWREWMKIENPDVKIVMDNISDFLNLKTTIYDISFDSAIELS